MKFFYLEKKARLNSMRVMHGDKCDLLPEEQGRIGLGKKSNLPEALLKAQSLYPRVKICKYCLEES